VFHDVGRVEPGLLGDRREVGQVLARLGVQLDGAVERGPKLERAPGDRVRGVPDRVAHLVVGATGLQRERPTVGDELARDLQPAAH